MLIEDLCTWFYFYWHPIAYVARQVYNYFLISTFCKSLAVRNIEFGAESLMCLIDLNSLFLVL